MQLAFKDLIKDNDKINVEDILSCWRWKLANINGVILVSCIGDVFLLGDDDGVYWLQNGECDFSKVAENLDDFNNKLNDEAYIDYWFLPLLVEKLMNAGKVLNYDQVYSYKNLPVIGGDYSVENMYPVNMGIHFATCGQICMQIKDLADGTKVVIKVMPPDNAK